eukprot:GHRQ01018490.1.p1 GENE.GHRQ01018490.1~~GHRQ01018490.1.p1  ORF type:complete len:157 (+),score=22.83 GHRQ01018490.1:354-824(+)
MGSTDLACTRHQHHHLLMVTRQLMPVRLPLPSLLRTLYVLSALQTAPYSRRHHSVLAPKLTMAGGPAAAACCWGHPGSRLPCLRQRLAKEVLGVAGERGTLINCCAITACIRAVCWVWQACLHTQHQLACTAVLGPEERLPFTVQLPQRLQVGAGC